MLSSDFLQSCPDTQTCESNITLAAKMDVCTQNTKPWPQPRVSSGRNPLPQALWKDTALIYHINASHTLVSFVLNYYKYKFDNLFPKPSSLFSTVNSWMAKRFKTFNLCISAKDYLTFVHSVLYKKFFLKSCRVRCDENKANRGAIMWTPLDMCD